MDDLATTTLVAEHMEFLRRLAHSLLRDANRADDAVQETWLQAVRTPPDHGPRTRAWLAQVLRNVVRKDWRGETRRKARESRLQALGTPEDPGTHLERIEQAEALLRALRGLAPAKRQVLELRYFQDLPPRAIAAELDIPVETVKTRIKRALHELRARLEETQGHGWSATLAAAFGLPMPAAQAAAGAPLAGLAIVGALLAVVGIGVWMLVRSSAGPGGSVAPEPIEEGSIPARGSVRAAGPELKGVATKPTPASSTKPSEPARTRPSKWTKDARTISGTFALLDEHGRRLAAPDGTLHFAQWIGGGGRHESAEVRAGAFTAQVAGAARMEFTTLELGDRIARVRTDEESVPVPEDGRFVLEAQIVADTMVRVLDADSGEELPEVRVLRMGVAISGLTHPGARVSKPREAGASPIALRPTLEDVENLETGYHIGSPGYAWTSIVFAAADAQDRTVELVRSGSAEVLVQGPALTVPAHVRLRRKREAGGYEAIVSYPLEPGATITCEGLPPGSYLARVELGDYFSRPRVLGQVAFEVQKGALAQASVTYEAMAKPPAVPLAGEIHVPTGWPLDRLQMCLVLCDPALRGQPGPWPVFRPEQGLTSVPDQPRTYAFDAGRVQAGNYLLSFRPYEYTQPVTIGREGNTSLLVEIPPPVTVQVVVEGDRGGNEPFLEALCWRRPFSDRETSHTLQTTKRASGDVPFEFQAPVGPLIIRQSGWAFLTPEQRIEVSQNATRFTLRVKPTAQVIVRMMDGEKVLRYDWDWAFDLKPISPDVDLIAHGGCDEDLGEGRGILATVTGPGLYKVSLGPIPGYLPVPDHEVEVGPERKVEFVIHLERK